jgi:hypothetical protein
MDASIAVRCIGRVELVARPDVPKPLIGANSVMDRKCEVPRDPEDVLDAEIVQSGKNMLYDRLAHAFLLPMRAQSDHCGACQWTAFRARSQGPATVHEDLRKIRNARLSPALGQEKPAVSGSSVNREVATKPYTAAREILFQVHAAELFRDDIAQVVRVRTRSSLELPGEATTLTSSR